MGYVVQDIIAWYQKKIGTNDKQQWEKTVEQRILNGFTNVPKRNARPKTELIDVDLVRGSSFSKAKPKHGLLAVTRLATIRLVFLPFFAKWWIHQTSGRVFALLLLLYTLQIVNVVIFTFRITQQEDLNENVTVCEILIPAAMMFVLSLVHSQIVSPHGTSVKKHSDGLYSSKAGRRVKRTKRRCTRVIPGSDSKSSPDTSSELTINFVDTTNKFNKRTRLRSSFEELSGSVRHRRCVAWDISTKSRLSLAESAEEALESLTKVRSQLPPPRPPPPLTTRCQGDREVTPLDDDGFESLNGNGSSDNAEEEHQTILTAQESSIVTPDVKQFMEHGTNQADDQKLMTSCVTGDYALNKGTLDVVYTNEVACELTESEVRLGADSVTSVSHHKWINGLTNRKHVPVPIEHLSSGETDHKDSDSDQPQSSPIAQKLSLRRRGSKEGLLHVTLAESSCNSESEEEEGSLCPEGTTSATEWIGITTNSECSVTSDIDTENNDHPFAWEFQLSSKTVVSPSCAASDKVSCTIWENRDVKKAELSVLDISSAIIARVEAMPESMDYFYGGILVSILLGALPTICRLMVNISAADSSPAPPLPAVPSALLIDTATSYISTSIAALLDAALGTVFWERVVVLIAMFERCILAVLFFFLLAVAERTFKQRFLYAKFFSHLTSFRRARKSTLPHFRLNKVRNIKTWLSVRSYLKKRGPQRSVDTIVSAGFIITLLLLSFFSVEFIKDSVRLHSEYSVEAVAWCIVLGFFLLRFMTLGTKINRKYRNLSVLITEQINLYLQIEQKPNKKEELMVANSVLKLAADLLKELESPYKISGLSANPYLYTITKVVILSALSGALSEMLGFKLKLHKIKIK